MISKKDWKTLDDSELKHQLVRLDLDGVRYLAAPDQVSACPSHGIPTKDDSATIHIVANRNGELRSTKAFVVALASDRISNVEIVGPQPMSVRRDIWPEVQGISSVDPALRR